MASIRRGLALLAAMGALVVGWTIPSQAEPACEPAKLATKYPSLAGKTLNIVLTGANAPFSFRDPGNFENVTGFAPDYARAAFACLGVPVVFKTADWTGLVASVTSGQSDLLWDELFYTPERAKALDFVVYMSASSGVYVPKGNPKRIRSFDDLCGKTAVALIGTIEAQKLHELSDKCVAEHKPQIEITTGVDRAGGQKLVETERADAYMGLASSPEYDPKDLDRAFVYQSGIKVGVATQKGAKPLEAAIFDAIVALKANGTERALLDKYSLGDLSLPPEILTQ